MPRATSKSPKPLNPALPPDAPALVDLQRLRDRRLRPQRDHSLAPEMDRAIRDAAILRRASGHCADAWNRIIPVELLAKTALIGVSKGVLTVRVPDAASRFQLDRFLRSGGQRAFIAACSASLRQVRIVVAG